MKAQLLVVGLLALLSAAPAISVEDQHEMPQRFFELSAKLKEGGAKGQDAREVILTLCNHSPAVAALAKPMFPTAWSVTRRYLDQGSWKNETRHAGSGRGKPSYGYPDRYSSDAYVYLDPGKCHETSLDLNWYLGLLGGQVKPGEYTVEFVYIYEPTADEASIPLITGPVRATLSEVRVDSQLAASPD